MNLVYFLVFENRKKSNIQPYYYIGSKSNCSFNGKEIIDSKGKVYYGSSLWENYESICKNEEIKVYIISEFEDYQECLNYEKLMHVKHDVVADTRYFNKSIATISSYSDPSYGSFRNIITGKTVRLPKDHPKVLNGEYVNCNKGYKTYNNGSQEKQFLGDPPPGWSLGRLEKNKRFGKDNSFYDKKHSDESKNKIIDTRNETYKNNPERQEKVSKILSETAKKTFTGVPKTAESNAKRGRKNLIMLKNKNTGETIRIDKSKKDNYDLEIWINPYKLAHEGKPNGSKWCTNGKDNIKLKPTDELPDGYRYGRTLKHNT
jgi:hypothetical protein